ncbi:MAG: energy transducer TonB [Ignavibacteriales bacterium]|nr:energy transducer TonB [Ignavibacteriales bacterium]
MKGFLRNKIFTDKTESEIQIKAQRSNYFDTEHKRIRFIAAFISISLHLMAIIGLMFYQNYQVNKIGLSEEMQFGGSGGGGGEGAEDDAIQFGPQGESGRNGKQDDMPNHQFTLLRIHVYNDLEKAIPVPVKEVPKPITSKKKKSKPVLAENMPTRWLRRGVGPGSGGGAGGGSGGGIGAGQGYSIDWGGNGSRRLLSGRLPKYPSGTDKEMPVRLEFSVLSDGTVSNVVPVMKSDELLERAAIAALQTWRFDPLPSQIEQKVQVGKITFKFVLQKE